MKLKIQKCEFVQRMVAILGHIVDENGKIVDFQKLDVIHNVPRSNNQTELCSFFGHRRLLYAIYLIVCIRKPATYAATFAEVFSRNEDIESVFCVLEHALTTTPVLAFLDFCKPFFLRHMPHRLLVTLYYRKKKRIFNSSRTKRKQDHEQGGKTLHSM